MPNKNLFSTKAAREDSSRAALEKERRKQAQQTNTIETTTTGMYAGQKPKGTSGNLSNNSTLNQLPLEERKQVFSLKNKQGLSYAQEEETREENAGKVVEEFQRQAKSTVNQNEERGKQIVTYATLPNSGRKADRLRNRTVELDPPEELSQTLQSQLVQGVKTWEKPGSREAEVLFERVRHPFGTMQGMIEQQKQEEEQTKVYETAWSVLNLEVQEAMLEVSEANSEESRQKAARKLAALQKELDMLNQKLDTSSRENEAKWNAKMAGLVRMFGGEETEWQLRELAKLSQKITYSINQVELTKEEKERYFQLQTELQELFGPYYDELLQYGERMVNEMATTAGLQTIGEHATENVRTATAASLASVPARVFGGIAAYGDAVLQKLFNGNVPVDWNSPNAFLYKAGTQVAQSVSQMIEKNTEGATFSNTPIGNLYSFLYGTGMSIADSLMAMSMGGFGTALLGGSAASGAMYDAIDRGATDRQAFTIGFLAGTFETVAEKLSIDKLFGLQNTDMAAAVVKNILKQSGAEASEEVLTMLANTAADYIVMGNKNQIDTRIRELMSGGLSKRDAEKKALNEWVSKIVADALGGAISGGTMAAGKASIDTVAKGVDSRIGAMWLPFGQTSPFLIPSYGENFSGRLGTHENGMKNSSDGVNTLEENVETDTAPIAEMGQSDDNSALKNLTSETAGATSNLEILNQMDNLNEAYEELLFLSGLQEDMQVAEENERQPDYAEQKNKVFFSMRTAQNQAETEPNLELERLQTSDDTRTIKEKQDVSATEIRQQDLSDLTAFEKLKNSVIQQEQTPETRSIDLRVGEHPETENGFVDYSSRTDENIVPTAGFVRRLDELRDAYQDHLFLSGFNEDEDSIDALGERAYNRTVRNSTERSASAEKQEARPVFDRVWRAWVKAETGWSDEVVSYIDTVEQARIYMNAGLKEVNVNGRICLVREIDWDYVDKKTGMTNRQLVVVKHRSPIDAKTGEIIVLHHMGQWYDAPFAELTINSEHSDGNHKTLHPKNKDSWRLDEGLEAQYNKERRQHWKVRCEVK